MYAAVDHPDLNTSIVLAEADVGNTINSRSSSAVVAAVATDFDTGVPGPTEASRSLQSVRFSQYQYITRVIVGIAR
jgi:hypothetical protein